MTREEQLAADEARHGHRPRGRLEILPSAGRPSGPTRRIANPDQPGNGPSLWSRCLI